MGSRRAKGKFILLCYYPICYPIILLCYLFSGVRSDKPTFGGSIGKIYPIILSVSGSLILLRRGRGLQMKNLSYYPIALRRGSDRINSLFGRPEGKVYPIILLSYYPIRFRVCDRINSPFGRPKGKVYPMIILPYLFQGARYDRPSLLGGDGVPWGKFILLSYCTICFRGRVGPGKVYPIILLSYLSSWGQIGQNFPKTRVLDRTSFLSYKCGLAILGVYPI